MVRGKGWSPEEGNDEQGRSVGPSSPDVVRGVVHGFRERTEPYGNGAWTVWTFRVDQYGDGGQVSASIPVEMRGFRMDGPALVSKVQTAAVHTTPLRERRQPRYECI